MSFQIRLHPQAQDDLEGILAWLSQRSPEGARTWYSRWHDVLQQLQATAAECSLAPESKGCRREIRHVIFRTRHGREYRALFAFENQTVVILHLRGPGQDLVNPDEVREP